VINPRSSIIRISLIACVSLESRSVTFAVMAGDHAPTTEAAVDEEMADAAPVLPDAAAASGRIPPDPRRVFVGNIAHQCARPPQPTVPNQGGVHQF
jgi:hypothetical protein